MQKAMMCLCALLIGAILATQARAAVVFYDDLDGTPGASLAGTVPDVGGSAWVNAGLQFNQILFTAGTGLGVQDVGPNAGNTQPRSALLVPFALSSLAPGEVAHLQVTMANISATPAANLLQASRVDLVTNTSGGAINLGEVTGGNWSATTFEGHNISSGITTGQSGEFLLDLYLDPNDAFRDGSAINAVLTVNDGCAIRGTILGLTTETIVSDIRLVRNVDDEVFFRGLTLETIPAAGVASTIVFHDDLDGTPGANLVGTVPNVGGNAWLHGGLQANQILFTPATGLGVQDVGPNSGNTQPHSPLVAPFALSSLPTTEVAHLQITMANIAANPAVNVLQSTRVDLVTNTSSGAITLGELGDGNWGSNSFDGDLISSGITTGQSGEFVLDLYLDPNDAYGDGVTLNAIVTVNHGSPFAGSIADLSSATTISEIRIVRNVDDEAFFRGIILETMCAPVYLHATGVEEGASPTAQLGKGFFVAMPNPATLGATISYRLVESGHVTLNIFDVSGRLVNTLVDRVEEASTRDRTVLWDGTDESGRTVGSGVFIYRIEAPGIKSSKKLVILK